MYNTFFILHFFGAICVFSAAAITFLNMMGMVFSNDAKRIWNCSYWAVKMERLWFFSSILLIITSFYMVFSRWGWKFPWIDISLLMMILMIAGNFMIHRQLKVIHQLADKETTNTPSLELIKKIRDSNLWSIVSMMALAVAGIIHLMIEKLGTAGSLLTFFITLLIGIIGSKTILYLANKSNQKTHDQPLT
ncbi:MAG: hypothetical protein Q8934_09790 [Bacillota bacterium]|nr:hypothetical protein [Bacillota bacterium]